MSLASASIIASEHQTPLKIPSGEKDLRESPMQAASVSPLKTVREGQGSSNSSLNVLPVDNSPDKILGSDSNENGKQMSDMEAESQDLDDEESEIDSDMLAEYLHYDDAPEYIKTQITPLLEQLRVEFG